MAITRAELVELIRQTGISKFKDRETPGGGEEVLFSVATETYRDRDGDPCVLLVARLEESGEYFKLFAPLAYKVVGANVAAMLKVCMIIQWQTKFFQFEYDAGDGEIRPVIEFPLEDATLTLKQFRRCVGALLQLVEKYHPVFRRAIDAGVVDFGVGEDDEIRRLQAALEEAKRRKAAGGQ